MHRPRRNLSPLAALLGTVLLALLSGCGREEPPDLVNGKKLFVGEGTCGSCHALERANTKASRGPNLDDAFSAARRDGFGESSFEGIVADQIKNVRNGSIMPENLVTGDDARDVAAYVAYAAGRGGKDDGELATAGVPQTGPPTAAKGGVLTIPANPTGALAFRSNKATAEAGNIEFKSPNQSPIQHNIGVKGAGVSKLGPVVGTGGVSTFAQPLKAGTYTFFCSVPTHEQGGMKGTLTVK